MPDPAVEREAVRLFERLLDVPEEARDAWIAEAAAERPELLSRLYALREADRRATLRTGSAAAQLREEDEETAPERIGAYRIVERIGRGGMGSVYLGERVTGDFAHLVAIKIVKPGLLSEALVDRFGRERQLLARLSHPNIARLYDGGEVEGSPYIVMEHVDGLPLLQYAEEQAASEERRRLFRDICGAVAFAHRHLIVHRDLTPSNVLVTREGVVKLIDFGIAKPADVDAEPGSGAVSGSIASLSLTPGYAAPERMTSSHVTTAADIYSLGRLLERLIPPGEGDRELKAIIARATAPEPAARYPTAEALSTDVEALARGFPVSAYKSGKRYGARKFVLRHRLAVAAASVAFLLLVGALVLTLRAYNQAEAARRAEAARFAELRSLANYMVFDLQGMLERVAGNAAARAAIADRAQAYLSALAASPDADDALKLEAGRGLVALAFVQGVPGQANLGQSDRAKANLTAAIGLLRGLPQRAETAPPLAEALTGMAMVQAHAEADADAAAGTLRGAAALLGAVSRGERGAPWHEARRRLRRGQIELAVLGQDIEGLLPLIGLLENDIGEWPATMQSGREAAFDRALALHYRGYHGYFTDRLDEAVRNFGEAERRLVRLDEARRDDPAVLFTLMWNGYVGYGAASGLPAEAAEARRFLAVARDTSARLLRIEPNDQAIKSFAANVRQAAAQDLAAQGRHGEAVALQREVVGLFASALTRARRPATLNRLAVAQLTLGNIAVGAGDRALACASYRASNASIEELARRDEMLGFVAAYREGVSGNVARCAQGGGGLEVLD